MMSLKKHSCQMTTWMIFLFQQNALVINWCPNLVVAKVMESGPGRLGPKKHQRRLIPWDHRIPYLGGGFKYFLFSSLPGEMIQFD